MMAVDMAMEAVLKIGLPSAAAGGATGAAAAAGAERTLPGGRSAAEGPEGFRAALRAAAGHTPSGDAAAPTPGEKKPSTVRKNGGPARAADSAEAAPADASSASGAEEGAESTAAPPPAAAGVSAEWAERLGFLNRPQPFSTGGAAGTALGAERIEPCGTSADGGAPPWTSEIPADGLNPLRNVRCASLSPPSTATAAGLTSMAGAADEAAVDASAGRLAQPRERARGSSGPELSLPDGPAADAPGEVPGIRPGASAAGTDSRHAAEDSFLSKTAATDAPAAGEGEALPEGFELLAREARPSTAAEGSLEKTTDVASASRDKETSAGSGRGVFDQIVQRAAVQLRNEQSEINIDLKPDFLGRVRMQVLTEHQQVSVRIFTELPAVRDMIETGLHLLKSELQSQGLQVERLEVAVADDHRQNGWQHAPHAQAWKPAGGELSGGEPSAGEERSEAAYDRSRPGGSAGIDMFV